MDDIYPAFPIKDLNDHPGPIGMTLRDAFAAKAMQGIMANPATYPTSQEHFDNIAFDSYRIAAAMLKARKA